MAATTEPQSPTSSNRGTGKRRRSPLRLVAILALIAIGTGAGMAMFLWWSDRELRAVEHHLAVEEFQAALRGAAAYLSQHPESTRAEILKGRALSGLGRHKAADAAFSRAARRANGFPNDLPAMRAWSNSLLHLELWSRADSLLQRIIDLKPDDEDALYKLTVARIRLRKYQEALAVAEQLAEVTKNAANAYVTIGTIHHDMGNRRKALDAWQKVLAGNPDAQDLNLPPYEFLTMVGEELLALGEPRRAVKVLERSIAHRETAAGYEFLGRAYAQSDRGNEAIQAWKKAVRLDSGSRIAREELAGAALAGGRPREAIDWLKPLMNSRRINSASAYLLQRSYAALKQPSESEKWRDRAAALRKKERLEADLNQSLRDNPSPFWSRFLTAYQSAADGDWERAKKLVDHLLQERPNEPALRQLSSAIDRRGPLPSLELLRRRKR